MPLSPKINTRSCNLEGNVRETFQLFFFFFCSIDSKYIWTVPYLKQGCHSQQGGEFLLGDL